MDSDAGRQDPRFKKNLVIKIDRPYIESRVETGDVSLGGASLYNAERYYDIQQVVHIEILLADGDSIFCNARVLSISPHTKNALTYKLNLQFIDMSDEDKEKLKHCLENY